MAVLKASRLKAVLDKARNAGQVEEATTIAGLDLVFRSLPSEAYNDIMAELAEVPETSYPVCYQIEHVCRSIVEINGESIRDVDYIEDEREGSSPVKVERQQWVRDNILATWSREMTYVAFRKVLDVIKGAEIKAAEGVKFRVESESDEEKYRRLLVEAKEVGEDLPEEMRAAVLKEHGFLEATSKAELDNLDARARTWEGEMPPAAEPPPPSVAPSPGPPRAPIQIVQAATADFAEAATQPPPSAAPQVSPEELMARRTPLNRTAIHEPTPQAQLGATPQVANRRSPPPPSDQVHKVSSRYAAIENLEVDPHAVPQHMPGQAPHDGDSPVVLEHRRAPVDKSVQTILDKPPAVGRNPKYSPPGMGLNPRSR